MTSLLALLYVAACARLAVLLRRRLGPVDLDRVGELLVFASLCATLFFGGHFVLACINLVTGAAIVSNGYALLTLSIALVALHITTRREAPARWRTAAAARPACLSRMTALAFALAGLMLAFGYPQGYEVQAYHLPTAVHQLQSHTLRAWDGNYPHTFPANASIYYAFALGALPEKFVAVADLFLLVPLTLAMFGLCRLAGADRAAAQLVCCGLLSVPMIAFSAVELGADIGGLACVAMALYFVLQRRLTPSQQATLAGLSAGLAFGFKSLHLISAVVLAVLLCAQSRSAGPRQMARITAIFTAAALATSAFWLLRNGIDYGNPFYPVNLPLLGDLAGWRHAPDVDLGQRHATQFEWVRTPSDWWSYPWREGHVHGQNFKHSGGLGPFIAASLPATLVVAGWRPRHPAVLPLSLASAAIVAVWWLLDDRQPRYALPALIYALPVVASMLTACRPPWRARQNALFSACIVVGLVIFLSRQGLLFADRILAAGHTSRSQFYEYPAALDHLPDGAVVLNLADRSWHYPLAGAGLRNRVVSMPEARRLSGLAPGLAAPPRASLNGAAMRAAGITHLFVTGTAVTPDACVELRELGRYDRNPVNRLPLRPARVLYSIHYHC